MCLLCNSISCEHTVPLHSSVSTSNQTHDYPDTQTMPYAYKAHCKHVKHPLYSRYASSTTLNTSFVLALAFQFKIHPSQLWKI